MLVIGPEHRAQIAEIRAVAAASVLDCHAARATAAQDMAGYRDMMRMTSLELPYGYRVTYSHERQPCGICQHISISMEWRLPAPPAVETILLAFGMRPASGSIGCWFEEVDPGTRALNVVQLLSAEAGDGEG